MDVAQSDQLGTNERIHEKVEKIKQFAREAPILSTDDSAEVQSLRDTLAVLWIRERELTKQVQEANRTLERERERTKVKWYYSPSHDLYT